MYVFENFENFFQKFLKKIFLIGLPIEEKFVAALLIIALFLTIDLLGIEPNQKIITAVETKEIIQRSSTSVPTYRIFFRVHKVTLNLTVDENLFYQIEPKDSIEVSYAISRISKMIHPRKIIPTIQDQS